MAQITGKILELQKSIRTLQLNITRLIAAYTERESITVAQFRVLLALASTENQTGPMTQLAQLLHITTPAVTHLIDKLEGQEVVKRTPHPTDRRSTLISLTPKGQSILGATQGEIIKLLTGTFLEFSESDQGSIMKFYKRLNENFSIHETKENKENA